MKYTTRPSIISLFIIFAFSFSISASEEFPYLDKDCQPIENCISTRDCSFHPSRDTRDCKKCLLVGPFGGGCAVRGNDPSCEASKAAQNAIYNAETTVKKMDCERKKAIEKLVCETTTSEQQFVCEAQKKQSFPNELIEYLTKIERNNCKELSSYEFSKLSELYSPEMIAEIEVCPVIPDIPFPNIFEGEDYGFSIGKTIFVDNNKNPSLRFWIEQVELSKLYQSYGINDLYIAMREAPKVISGIVDEKVKVKCKEILCDKDIDRP